MISFDSLATGQSLIALQAIEGKQVPQGTSITIAPNQKAIITQALGQSLTVNVGGQLARIDTKDFSKFGISEPQSANAEGSIEDKIWHILKQTYDPEIPINIVELGLIYDLTISTLIDNSTHVSIDMTLTSPGCGMGPILANDLKTKIEYISGVDRVAIQIVFDPPWDASRMSEEARLESGLF